MAECRLCGKFADCPKHPHYCTIHCDCARNKRSEERRAVQLDHPLVRIAMGAVARRDGGWLR